MLYQIYSESGQTRIFTEPGSRCVLRYFSKQEILKRYQDINFSIIGEIGSFARSPDKADFLLTNSGRKIPIHPRGSLIRPFEWVIGYTAMEKNTYLAVVRSLLCCLLHCRKSS